MQGLSQRIVDFIAALEPSYTRQLADGRECALCLADGTLLMPMDESHATHEEGWVAVLWQGDGLRRSEVPGSLLASRAILQHAQLLGIGRPPEAVVAAREVLLAHFTQRTGIRLHPDTSLTAAHDLHPVRAEGRLAADMPAT
ncbi:MAG: hypothetical protein EPN68_03400 [Rhodanobacter sp.]|nr:MAG: hypothetical protein EPN68_03400 [Rhodanobacter sp.]